jgi:hypothetical protein
MALAFSDLGAGVAWNVTSAKLEPTTRVHRCAEGFASCGASGDRTIQAVGWMKRLSIPLAQSIWIQQTMGQTMVIARY